MKRYTLVALFPLAACVPNPYAKFYEGAPDARVRPDYIAPTSALQIFSSSDFNRDVPELMRHGYVLVGQSSFNAGIGNVKESQLRDQAASVGAALVLVSSHYTNTITGAIPLNIPQTSTTTGTATATAYGPGGSATATGYGTSTTTRSQTVMMPYSVARADFAALYFVRTKARLGLFVIALDDSTRQRLQSNAGVRVAVVVENSPAFDADILPGDIVLALGGERVRSPEHYGELLTKYEGQRVEISLSRSGRELTKSVTLLKL